MTASVAGSPDLRQSLEGRVFRFGRVDQTFIGNVFFQSDGTLAGYTNDNEARWDVVDGRLVFQDRSGKVTTDFTERSMEGDGFGFKGAFLPLGPGLWHELSEITDRSSAGVLEELRSTLYGSEAPFDFVDTVWEDNGYPHTHISPEVIDWVLDAVKPRFWLELGSMLGGSAIRVADAIKRRQAPTQIICIDPFTGDVNMWAWEQPFKDASQWRFLRLDRGKPTIYDRFIANVAAAGHADIVLPICASSLVGLKLLSRLSGENRLSALPDVIYLDSAHEPDETFLELQASWRVLRPGGVLFGDDWDWEAVRNDVRRFAQTVDVAAEHPLKQHAELRSEGNILLGHGHWLLVKPGSSDADRRTRNAR